MHLLCVFSWVPRLPACFTHFLDMCVRARVCVCIQNDIEMPIPKYFTHERSKALKEREKLLGQILAKLGPQDKDSVNI